MSKTNYTKSYRLLKRHEQIQRGDQFQRGNRWLNCTMFFGSLAGDFAYAIRRAAITQAQLEAFGWEVA